MKKVTIFSLHLGFGGLEKSVVALANAICSHYQVEIVSTYKLYEESAFHVDSRIQVTYLIDEVKPNGEEWKNALRNKRPLSFIKESYKAVYCLFLRKQRTIRAMKEVDADIAISTRCLFNGWLGRYVRKGTKKIAWEHNHHHGNVKYVKKVVDSCKNIDQLVLVSDSLRNFYKKEMKKANYKCHCVTIPNILDYLPEHVSPLTENRIISIGRFSREKGFPDLIDVFQKVYEKNPKLRLDLIGDGAQKNMVVDKIYQYHLENVVTVHGFLTKDKINSLLAKSSLYLMTSYTESFGIVLIEAMSFGIPCIAFSSAEGACELIQDGENGYLINDRSIDEMAEKVLKLMKDYNKRRELGKNARKTSEHYTVDIVKEMWLKLLK